MVAKCVLWCHLFLPEHFRDATPEFHRELIRRLLSGQNEYIAAPRGHGKTSVLQGVLCFIVANQLEQFCVVIEKSHTEATEVLRVVREEWKENPRILTVYGECVSADTMGRGRDVKETEDDILINGVRFRAKGFETPIRGLKAGAYRPTKIFLDDVENDEQVRSEDQRRKYMENFTQGVLPALDIHGSVKVVGTILHFASLLRTLIDSHAGIVWGAYDSRAEKPEETILWPERWSWEMLEEKRKDMELEGLPGGKFSQEYLNEPIDDERRSFKAEWLNKRFKESDIETKQLNRFAVLDVADSTGKKNDYTGCVVTDWDADDNWYLKYVKRYRVNITALVDLIFWIWDTYHPMKIGIEKKSLADQVKPLLKAESEKRGVYPVVVEMTPRGRNKEQRILGALQGRFEHGKIYFKENATDDSHLLRGELYDFPMGKNDDICDALSYVGELGCRPYSGGTASNVPSTLDAEIKEYLKSKKKSLKRLL